MPPRPNSAACRALLRECDAAQDTARVLQCGPINCTYHVSRPDGDVVVRRRLPNLSRNNQRFAAEEYLVPLVGDRVRIPALLCVDRSRTRPLAVFRFIDGAAPDWRHPTVRDQLVATLCQTHAVLGTGVGPIGSVRRVGDYGAYLQGMFRRELGRFRRIAVIGPAEERELSRRARNLSMFAGRAPTLCHGDVHSGNFIVDRAGVLWTIDWEAARFRFPESDFNQIHLGWIGRAERDDVISAYCARTHVDERSFRSGVTLFQLLWHLRTYNFFVGGQGEPAPAHRHHVEGIGTLLGDAP